MTQTTNKQTFGKVCQVNGGENGSEEGRIFKICFKIGLGSVFKVEGRMTSATKTNYKSVKYETERICAN